jgi:hypothetical protein
MPTGPSSTSAVVARADLRSGVEGSFRVEGGFLEAISVAKGVLVEQRVEQDLEVLKEPARLFIN